MKLHESNEYYNKANVHVPLLSVNTSENLTVNDPLFERMLDLATAGLEASYFSKLKKSLCQTNALTIANYIPHCV